LVPDSEGKLEIASYEAATAQRCWWKDGIDC
jgi:hypothetical protein